MAGFSRYVVTPTDNYCEFRSVEEFVYKRILGSPLADNLPEKDQASVIKAIEKEASTELKEFVINGRLKFPVKANILKAEKHLSSL